MRILYDHQTFTKQSFGGISRYFYELTKRFKKSSHDGKVSLLLSNNEYLNKNSDPNVRSFFPENNFKGKLKLQYALNTINSIRYLKGGNYDVFHPTYYDTYFLKYLKKKPFVITFLDMIHEKYENQYDALKTDGRVFEDKKILLREAAKIIAISQNTKNDIVDIYNISPSMIDVVYLGSSFNPQKIDKGNITADPRPYILFVGNRGLYKNFNFYIESVAGILISEDINFICAGAGSFTAAELELIKKLGLEKRVFHYAIDDLILEKLYANAIAFVFPSLYEGFGIPVLEAFSCECVCLLSKGGSLPEVGGDAAIYFDPLDAAEIRSSLMLVLSREFRRTEFLTKGLERLKLFSWDKNFEQTIDIYNEILR